MELQLKYLNLCNALFCDVNPIPVKHAMNMLGYKAGSCRLPLVDMDEAKQQMLKKELINAGIL